MHQHSPHHPRIVCPLPFIPPVFPVLTAMQHSRNYTCSVHHPEVLGGHDRLSRYPSGPLEFDTSAISLTGSSSAFYASLDFAVIPVISQYLEIWLHGTWMDKVRFSIGFFLQSTDSAMIWGREALNDTTTLLN